MNVLVTGAAGFIGAHVCRRLLADGHRVTAVVEPGLPTPRLDPVRTRLTLVECDLFRCDDEGLRRLGNGIDRAIHAAWYAVPGKYLTSPANLDALAGSLRLFAALWSAGCRSITGIGTCLEYRMADRPLREDDPCDPSILYAAAKLSTWLTGRELARILGGRLAWARLFYLYGPEEAPARLIPDLAGNLLRGQRVAVTEGRQVRDYLHVEDVASAITAIATGEADGVFNVGSGEPRTVREIIATLAAYTGGADRVDYGARPANLMDPPYIVADTTRVRSETNWKPAYTLESGLAQTVAWWKEKIAATA